jgi:ATP-binding cassette subfamily B protein
MPTGELMSRVTSDVDMIRGFLAWGFPQFISIIAMFIGVFAITLSISWKLTIMALATAPILLLTAIRFSRKIRPVFTIGQERLAVINAVLQENISGVKVVRAFAKEDLEEHKFMEKSKDYFNTNIIAAKFRAMHIPLMELMSGLGTVLILLYGGIQVISGEITIGTLVLFNSYLFWRIYWLIGVSACRLSGILDHCSSSFTLNTCGLPSRNSSCLMSSMRRSLALTSEKRLLCRPDEYPRLVSFIPSSSTGLGG